MNQRRISVAIIWTGVVVVAITPSFVVELTTTATTQLSKTELHSMLLSGLVLGAKEY